MLTPEDGLDNLKSIFEEYYAFNSKRGEVSEADTRAKVVDKILCTVLDWRETNIIREESFDKSRLDYLLKSGDRNIVVVEAKKSGSDFIFPVKVNSRQYKLSHALLIEKNVRDSLLQVKRYCDDCGARFAIATNGYSWILFRANSDGKPWKDGYACVFSSPKEIMKDFAAFWNLLNFNEILNGSLDKQFSKRIAQVEKTYRAIDHLRNPDKPLMRNAYAKNFSGFIEHVFKDIGGDGQNQELLKQCYVTHRRNLERVDSEIATLLEDYMPNFLASEGVERINVSSKQDPGVLGNSIGRSASNKAGTTLMLLGGVGSGKTTYINRYFKLVGKELIDENAIWCRIDLKAPPQDHSNLERHVYENLLALIRSDEYRYLNLENRAFVEEAYSGEIDSLRQLAAPGTSEADIQKKISKRIDEWITNPEKYAPKLLNIAQLKRDRILIIVLDNVDQLSSEYQQSVFYSAQKIARDCKAIVLVALREETYYSATVRKIMSAYHADRKFHIPAPYFKKLVLARINYLLTVLLQNKDVVQRQLGINADFDKELVIKIMDIIKMSLSNDVVLFIETMSYGNMRIALEMFARFLNSGATDIHKMLAIYSTQEKYFISLHEFIKSTMLDDRAYYKEQMSGMLNIYFRTAAYNNSHFTGLRILKLLDRHINSESPPGRGYISISNLLETFAEVFDNESDTVEVLDRMLDRGLVQSDTRQLKTTAGAEFVRISASGLYMLKYLAHRFAYLDIVFIDTPCSDPAIALQLAKLVEEADEIKNSKEFQLQKNQVRFNRVDIFLEYLKKEEAEEHSRYNLGGTNSVFSDFIMSEIIEKYNKEKDRVNTKVATNLVGEFDNKELNDLIRTFLPEVDRQEDMFED